MLRDGADPVWEILACSQCGAPLSPEPEGAKCTKCQTRFGHTPHGGLDLRLRATKKFPFEFELGSPPPQDFPFVPLPRNPRPEVAFPAGKVPWHLTPQLLSHFPRARSATSFALDLGCGSGLHRFVCEQAGYRWVGLDYTADRAPILGDGHALPFANESFEFVLSIAVLEHIQYPFVVGREVLRVLKPGGLYIGTVAFLEPFHGNSYYHHTHLGTYNTLRSAGFGVEYVGPNAAWSGLKAQASMGGLFPRMPEALGHAVVWPIEMLHRTWWKMGRLASRRPNASEQMRLVTNTGAFEFIARKPREDGASPREDGAAAKAREDAAGAPSAAAGAPSPGPQ